MQIDIDFEVFKALTVRRANEEHSYNEVLRSLLGLDDEVSPDDLAAAPPANKVVVTAKRRRPINLGSDKKPFVTRYGDLPHGTCLRAIYQGQRYTASIDDGRWVAEDGTEHASPSGAAGAITGTNVNGLRFWRAKRPNDTEWQRLDVLLALSK
ncbi:DUF4357 domain-containing protein [Sphingomonas sp. 37zxx]|uniref:DUF4357 domain-containing protein n=1 Tax=Sphingomonas sp. 37zxx TaxID=1550073 RepID=UPI0009E09E66|nr:DUF4357 domain-containing protein [Sphingomonas sp. 37zxx]